MEQDAVWFQRWGLPWACVKCRDQIVAEPSARELAVKVTGSRRALYEHLDACAECQACAAESVRCSDTIPHMQEIVIGNGLRFDPGWIYYLETFSARPACHLHRCPACAAHLVLAWGHRREGARELLALLASVGPDRHERARGFSPEQLLAVVEANHRWRWARRLREEGR